MAPMLLLATAFGLIIEKVRSKAIITSIGFLILTGLGTCSDKRIYLAGSPFLYTNNDAALRMPNNQWPQIISALVAIAYGDRNISLKKKYLKRSFLYTSHILCKNLTTPNVTEEAHIIIFNLYFFQLVSARSS
ncbi:hypothetical protein okayama9524_29240 [Yersinia pseudotuberculosis]